MAEKVICGPDPERHLAAVRQFSPRVEYYSIDEFFFEAVPHRGLPLQGTVEAIRDHIRLAVLNIPFSAAPGLCIRSGYMALREIAPGVSVEEITATTGCNLLIPSAVPPIKLRN